MSKIIKPADSNDIVKGRILWGVRVIVGEDGQVTTEGPLKIIPRSGPEFDVGMTYQDGGHWYFNVKNSRGEIAPVTFGSWNIWDALPTGADLPIHYNRLFTKRRDAVSYISAASRVVAEAKAAFSEA